MHIVMMHTLPWWMCAHSDGGSWCIHYPGGCVRIVMMHTFTETYTSRNQLHCVHVQSRNILYEKVGGK